MSSKVELTVFRVTFPVLTFVAAEDHEQAIELAKKVWSDHDLDDVTCNWNSGFNDVEVDVFTDANCYGEGVAYYDEDRWGLGYRIPLQEGVFVIELRADPCAKKQLATELLEEQIKDLQERLKVLKP